MSDEEEYSEEDEEEKPPKEEEKPKSEAELVLEKQKTKQLMGEDDEQWADYIAQWRKQRAKEEEELRDLKEKQKKRKAEREDMERNFNEKKKKEEEQRLREIEEKKEREKEDKRLRLEEAEKKRQAMLTAQKKVEAEQKPNFVIQKRTDAGPGASVGNTAMDKMMNVAAAKGDLGKTKEQLAEDKKIALTFRIVNLEMEGLTLDKLKEKCKELWELVVKLETEKYDLEERQKRQDYDLKELNERQRQINRNKALKLGLDPEALSGKYPPKLQVASKYERRIDRRTYDDKRGLFNGGFEAQYEAILEKTWTDHFTDFSTKKGKVPKWMGENPGKKGTVIEEEEGAQELVYEEQNEEEEEED